ncbi:transposase [Streptomyces phaeochromogenes]|uniref:transposase n=1 Tax=Streptomyces phaeochromogenes TaxID=1923 RepID=UPI00225C21BC|nr:transposase [Streptomyces phaeochromogenes]
MEATLAQQEWTAAFGDVMAQVADCFPRRDSRLLAREAVQAMLMELERRSCWSLAEALGHGGPHRLQHFLSRGVWDHDLARDRLAVWAAGELAGEEAVLVVDETGDGSHRRWQGQCCGFLGSQQELFNRIRHVRWQ